MEGSVPPLFNLRFFYEKISRNIRNSNISKLLYNFGNGNSSNNLRLIYNYYMNKFYIFGLLSFTLNAFSCSDLLDTDMRILDSAESRNLCEFEGKALLVVNVASRCGYTYQYAGLQELYENYKDDDFLVIGIPSRDFLQEYSDESDVAEFCSTEYGVDFPMFSTVKVRGKKAHPFYKKLIAETGFSPSWNFNKYLISKEGKVVSTYGSKVKPDSEELISAIEGLL